jgi:uncharacterized RDD family membrane protein YckC
MSETEDPATAPAAPTALMAPTAPTAPIAGFWRRTGAFLIDSIVLAVVGWVVGIAEYDELVSIGGGVLLIGAAITLVYFALFDSVLAPSPGKRLLGLRIVDARGRGLPLPRAALRCLVLQIPWFANGAPLPAAVADAAWARGMQWIVVLGWGGALVYLYLFNRTTRRSLHELATGAFVVEAGKGTLEPAVHGTPRLHLAVAAGWILVVGSTLVWGPGLPGLRPDPEILARLESAERAVDAVPTVVDSSVTRFDAASGRSATYSVQAFVHDPPADVEALARQVVAAARSVSLDCGPDDRFAVVVTRGFSLGIASFWWNHRQAKTCAEWDAEAAGAVTPGGR